MHNRYPVPHMHWHAPARAAVSRMHQPESSAVLRATAATSAAPKEHVLAHEHLLLLAV